MSNELRVVGSGVGGDGRDVDGGDDMILEGGETALEEDSGCCVRNGDECAAEQVMVADVKRDAGGGDQPDTASGWGGFEKPVGSKSEPEREGECDDDNRETLDPDVRADAAAHGVEHATDA